METWKILLISLLAAVALGSVGGILIGKYMVKRAKTGPKRLLSNKERIIYAACLVLGTACILFGVFFKFPSPADSMMQDGMVIGEDGEYTEDGEGGATVNAGGGRRSARGGGGGAVVFRAAG